MDTTQFSNFEFIWEKWIVPLINKAFAQMDETFKSAVGAKKVALDKVKPEASKYFQELRSQLKVAYYGDERDKAEYHRLDFCKLGAVICKTMIEYKVIQFDVDKCKIFTENIDSNDTDWLVKNALVNYRIAFYAGIIFLFKSMLFKYKNEEKLINKLQSAKKLDLYFDYNSKNTNERFNNEKFDNYIILNLAKRDVEKRSFDHFMFSALLLGIEEFNLALIKQN